MVHVEVCPFPRVPSLRFHVTFRGFSHLKHPGPPTTVTEKTSKIHLRRQALESLQLQWFPDFRVRTSHQGFYGNLRAPPWRIIAGLVSG